MEAATGPEPRHGGDPGTRQRGVGCGESPAVPPRLPEGKEARRLPSAERRSCISLQHQIEHHMCMYLYIYRNICLGICVYMSRYMCKYMCIYSQIHKYLDIDTIFIIWALYSTTTKELFKANKCTVLRWPSQSPDLNPMELHFIC